MKRLLLTVIILLVFTFMASAQKSWVGFTSDTPELPQVTIEEQNDTKIVLNISIKGIYSSEITEEDQVFQRLELFENKTTKEIGKPELPMINELIGIPGNKLVKVKILSQETTSLDNYRIYPFQTPTTDNSGGHSHEFVINERFYNENSSYPGNQVYFDRSGIWRDVKVAGLHIIPFDYNATKGELEITTNLKLEIEFYGNDTKFVLNRSKEVTPMFYKMYQNNILNFQTLGFTKETKGNDDIKYLIITNTEAVNSIQPLVDWKNQQGFKVEVQTMMQPGFNTPQNFKDYISDLYTSDNLEYILMVGDAYPNGGNSGGPNDVPMYYWAPSGEDASYSDSWYSCLDGPDDHYADIAVGRFTYDNISELDLQIQKTIDHYFNPDINTNWAENSILIAHKEQYPGKYTQCCEEIRTFPYALQTPIFEPAYGGEGYTNNQVVDYVNNNSCGIFNYRGHGSATELWEWTPQGSFTAQHVNQLTNEERLFVFFDVCCDNMDIVAHSGNCLCESFIKSDVAAVAVNGAIIPSYTIPNHDYDKEMYKAVFNEGIYNIGYVTNYANVTVLNDHGEIGRSNVRTYLWLGDASIEPWTLQPAELSVTHDEQLFLGLSDFSVVALGSGGPQENALVCVSNEDGSVYGVAYTDASGYAQVLFDQPIQDAGTAKVTVSIHNHLPYQADIAVIPEGPYVIKESFMLNDQAGGNGDGLMDYGESPLLSLSVKNVGISQATNVVVTLTTTDPYITFTDDNEAYGDVNPEEIVEMTDAFAFDVANDIPDGHYILIEVEASGDDKAVWNSSFSIEGYAPVLELETVSISDPTGNNNGKIDPGETVDLIITTENSGSSEAFNIIGELILSDPYLTINTSEFNYGDLAGGASADGSFSVTANINTPAGHLVDIEFNVAADLGISGSGTFEVVIGQIPVLILDLDENGNSAPGMEAALSNMDVSYEKLTSFPPDLNLYSTVFVCLGIFSSNHVLSSGEGQTLADYLNSGGSLYMEGGDTWAYDSQTTVHSMFNINGTEDGSSNMGTVSGQTGTFTEGMSFNYSGENSYMDHLVAVSPAFTIFENQSPNYGTAIAYDEGTYKTIGASHEFGGLDDGTSPSTKEQLMIEYLNFLGILNSLQSEFSSSTTETCSQGSIDFFDQSSGNIVSWEWTFEGGSPETSTDQNPVVTYSSSGEFDVTLTVSDDEESNTLTIENYIIVVNTPEMPGTPSGDNEICTNFTQFTEYTTSGAMFADEYIWEILPAEAGTIDGDGTTTSVEWTTDWVGAATIKVKGYNEACGEGGYSELFEVNCSICTAIDEYGNLAGIAIYPNPSNGQFTVKFDNNIGNTEIIVLNTLNKVLYTNKTETIDEQSVIVDIGNLSKGVYFIRLKTESSEIIKKIIIQ